jgi:hypothetical protein
MGRFSYGEKITVDFDDRLLTHLQAVIAAKLRRGESFMFTWVDDDSIGDGHTSVWVNPTVTVAFKYFGKRQAALNRAWIEQLMMTANSTTGLRVIAEPQNGGHGDGES